MNNMPCIVRSLLLAVTTMFAMSAHAQLSGISNADAASGLRQALTEGAHAAVAKLSVENGFFADGRVKIPLPPVLQRVEGAMRAILRRLMEPLSLILLVAGVISMLTGDEIGGLIIVQPAARPSVISPVSVGWPKTMMRTRSFGPRR